MNLDFDFAFEYEKVHTTKARYIILMGGRGRGGSYTAVQLATYKLLTSDFERIYFMRQIFGDIKTSLKSDFVDLIRDKGLDDFFEIPEQLGAPIKCKLNANEIYCKGFKKSDNSREAKVKSISNVTKVIIEEANEVSEEDFDKLDDSLRTTKGELQIILILNPPQKDHWILKRWFNLHPITQTQKKFDGYYKPVPKAQPDLLGIVTNYKCNLKNLNESTITKFETYYPRSNPHYWKKNILGLVPKEFQGVYYKNYEYVKTFPCEGEFIYVVDFGFSIDPCAIAKIMIEGSRVFVRELHYDIETSNEAIADILNKDGIGNSICICDSSEPKSIDRLRQLGVNAKGVEKGSGSVETGIKQLQSMKILLVGSNPKLTKELQEYRPNKKTGKPQGADHLIDAIRYGVYYQFYSNKTQHSETNAGKRQTTHNQRRKNSEGLDRYHLS